jgi:hypothetical protein
MAEIEVEKEFRAVRCDWIKKIINETQPDPENITDPVPPVEPEIPVVPTPDPVKIECNDTKPDPTPANPDPVDPEEPEEECPAEKEK